MPVIRLNIEHSKKQTKMNDCWYACIQMLLSYQKDGKVKPQGQAAMDHRGGKAAWNSWWGRAIDFSSPVGRDVLAQNNLLDITQIDSVQLGYKSSFFMPGGGDWSRIDTLHVVMSKYGPILVGGKFGHGIFSKNTYGHFMVISGCDTDGDKVWYYDPWKTQAHTEHSCSFDYIENNRWKQDQGVFIVRP